MTASDNKVLIEGINFTASATDTPTDSGQGQADGETADSSHTSAHISIIHLRDKRGELIYWEIWTECSRRLTGPHRVRCD